jgi:NitT/TauT family transport system substrate-binding protein
MATELTPIKVVPHFMRLHEWIALEGGYYQDEGLEPVLMADVMHSVSGHRGDGYGRRPQDLPFVEEMEDLANSACAWGSVCNAGAGMGRFVSDLYGVGRFAIFTRDDSPHQRLTDLRDVPVGVGLRAGSHFTTLQTLEQVLPKEHIKVQHTGGPGRRLVALTDGEVDAATLLDPEIPIAEARGLRRLAEGEFRTLFWVSASIDPETLGRYFRALRRADEDVRASPEQHVHLWERNVPPELHGDYDYSRFGLGELLFFEPFDEDMLNEAVRFAERWELGENLREQRYENLVAPVTI